MVFPAYRSLEGFDRHYLILSESEFVEAFKIGEDWKFQQVKASQYPEFLRIQDMLSCSFQFVESKKAIETLFNDFFI